MLDHSFSLSIAVAFEKLPAGAVSNPTRNDLVLILEVTGQTSRFFPLMPILGTWMILLLELQTSSTTPQFVSRWSRHFPVETSIVFQTTQASIRSSILVSLRIYAIERLLLRASSVLVQYFEVQVLSQRLSVLRHSLVRMLRQIRTFSMCLCQPRIPYITLLELIAWV